MSCGLPETHVNPERHGFFPLCTQSCLKMKMTSLQVLCKLAFSGIKTGSFKTLWESLLFSMGDKSAEA